MPELPEVESLRRSLIPYLVGHSIQSVEVKKPKLVTSKGTVRESSSISARGFEMELENETCRSIERRAKNLIFKFESGKILLVHLKMTGQLVFKSILNETVLGGHPIEASETTLPNKHSHVIFEMDNGTLYYNDVRMFGYLLWYQNEAEMNKAQHFEGLGVEPLGEQFTLDYFKKALRGKKSKLKAILLDQKIVVGLGNIYCDEVCFAARVRPYRTVANLTSGEIEKIFVAIINILGRAVKAGGSSVANYLMADGSRGNFAHEHMVYNRGGKECKVCGEILEKTVINSRTTVYCFNCQK